jgi:hypothetical protein
LEFKLQLVGAAGDTLKRELAVTALAASEALPENVNYAVKIPEGRHVAVLNFRDADTASLPVLESVHAVSAKLKAPVTADRKLEDVVMSAQETAVLVY